MEHTISFTQGSNSFLTMLPLHTLWLSHQVHMQWQLVHLWKGSFSSQYQMFLFLTSAKLLERLAGSGLHACPFPPSTYMLFEVQSVSSAERAAFIQLDSLCLWFSWPRCNYTGAVGALEGLPALHIPFPASACYLLFTYLPFCMGTEQAFSSAIVCFLHPHPLYFVRYI